MDREVKATHVNGKSTCPVYEDWAEHKEQTKEIANKIVRMHSVMEKILDHTTHLHKLDKLDNLSLLVAAVTGKNDNEGKLAYLVARVLGLVIVGLTIIIVGLLTGQHFGFVKLVNNV